MHRVALATSAALPDLDDDGPLLRAALASAGIEAVPAVWDDPHEAWGAYDLVVVRSTWDYTDRREEFLAWARRVPRLLNSADVLAWNTDKRYLAELAAAGVPVVPTVFAGPGDEVPVLEGEVVVKPTVSAGARDTARHSGPASAAAHVRALQAAGRTAMVQPYLPGVETAGETSVLVFGGEVSHAARKGPLLLADGSVGDVDDPELMSPRTASDAELEVVRLVLAAAPAVLYARVDLVPGPDGPVLMELELTEPSLFLREAPESQRFASAVRAALR